MNTKLYRNTQNYIVKIEEDSVFVEIGSASHQEGSTLYYADLAHQYNTILHTVDLNNTPENMLANWKQHFACQWHAGVGSDWCHNYASNIGKKISFLYLDNFDYMYSPPDGFIEQITKYKEKFNIDMTNRACQIEHFKQILFLTPWLADDCVVIMDDTYLWNECWVGKCGPVVVYLQTQGFKIIDENYLSFEVVMRRG
jgi:hypothetical protein